MKPFSLYRLFCISFLLTTMIAGVPWVARAQSKKEKADLLYQQALDYSIGRNGVTQDLAIAYKLERKAADAGNVWAMYKTGLNLEIGSGVKKDLRQAEKYYRRAAEKGNASSQISLGRLYLDGDLPGGPSKAVQYFQMARENPVGAYYLGKCQMDGVGIARNQAEGFDLIKRSAENGFYEAQSTMGRLYEEGNFVGKDRDKALEWYQKSVEQELETAGAKTLLFIAKYKGWSGLHQWALIKKLDKDTDDDMRIKWYKSAAEAGSADACILLSLGYQFGFWSLPQNKDEEIKYTFQAAELGDATSQLAVGGYHYRGDYAEPDLKKAFHWYMKAARQGDPVAQCNVGILYLKGEGVQKNESEAVKWLSKSHEQGNGTATSQLGICYLEGTGVAQNDKEGVRLLQQAAEKNEPGAYVYLGYCYLQGRGVPINEPEAVKWLQKGLEQDEPEEIVYYWLGKCYLEGMGVPKDVSEGLKLIRLGTDKGVAVCQCEMGEQYYYGENLKQDYATALEWFQLAARQGDSMAQHMIGLVYFLGNGVPKNSKEAVKWFRLAANQDQVNACYMLGQCLYMGEGVAEDQELGLYWLKRAARLGNSAAEELLKKL